jgi:hypothetical protein
MAIRLIRCYLLAMGIRDRWQRFRAPFRKPAMIGTPPSQRPLWHDPAAHAKDFALRYAEELEQVCSVRMEELGLPSRRIGFNDPDLRGAWRVFFPDPGKGGVVFGDGIGVDSGILNPDLMKPDYGRKAGRLFEKSRLRDRLGAIIAHEYEESRVGTHAAALKAAPRTALPISERAREICAAMEKGWRGR